MAPPKLTPDDFRAAQKSTTLNGKSYTYYHFLPSDSVADTIFLLHGFPDHPFTYRHLIPHLLLLKLQVVIPALPGYGKTYSPTNLENYTYKTISSDLFALAAELGVAKQGVIMGGHDWGGALVYRVSLWHPSLVRGIFSICTPFSAPVSPGGKKLTHPASILPNLKYQIQYASPEIENAVGKNPAYLKGFLNAMFGGRNTRAKPAKPAFDAKEGVDIKSVCEGGISESPLVRGEEMEFYVEELNRQGLGRMLNWYRTYELNTNDEATAHMSETFSKFKIPTLFVAGKKDQALPPSMSKKMPLYWEEGLLEMREVDTNHWALWEKPAEVNALVVNWLRSNFGLGDGAGQQGEEGGKAKL